MIAVSVCIPTFRRPAGFMRAARSVFAQDDLRGVELIAIDNSPEGGAIECFGALEKTATIPFRWAHEPRPGVANARNAALALARGEYIAWLDDDEEAPAHWLSTLSRVRRETGADAVFGPVRAQAGGPHRAFFEQIYSRTGPARSGPCANPHGIGNSLQPRRKLGQAPFDPRANETGGEDDALFSAWANAGARFAWAAEAFVVEHVEPERTQLAHGLRRAFAYGQAPCETAWSNRAYASLLRHMAIGAGQFSFYAPLFVVIAAFSKARALPLLDKAARGAGKVCWFRKQRFYGHAALNPTRA